MFKTIGQRAVDELVPPMVSELLERARTGALAGELDAMEDQQDESEDEDNDGKDEENVDDGSEDVSDGEHDEDANGDQSTTKPLVLSVLHGLRQVIEIASSNVLPFLIPQLIAVFSFLVIYFLI